MTAHWLVKAEPLPRIVKGVDVSFSVDKFAHAKVSPWEGVRNYQARGFLRDQMKPGQPVLFYHSSCPLPGIAALAEVCSEGYPDHNAWDPKHPYYDPKSSKDEPRWYMVDVRFCKKVDHFVPLALLQHISSSSLTKEQRANINYLTDKHIEAIKSMPLLHRSRLSVQPVDKTAFEAICLLGQHGGFDAWPGKWSTQATRPAKKPPAAALRRAKRRRT